MNRAVRIAVFAKAPVPGQTKTRLIPALGAAGAAALQAVMIRHSLITATQCRAELELWCHPDPHHPLFRACAHEFGLICRTQRGADLGARMQYAAAASLAAGPVVIIGTDCPALSPADLTEAFAALTENDAVLGPARDGGYYLLGLRRLHPSLFEGVHWGTSRVLRQTRQRLQALGWRWQELAERDDIDRPEDLALLPEGWR